VVKGLVIRRSNFRGISPDIIFRLIHEGFPQLQGIRVEKVARNLSQRTA
jgi:hypothetical protein